MRFASAFAFVPLSPTGFALTSPAGSPVSEVEQVASDLSAASSTRMGEGVGEVRSMTGQGTGRCEAALGTATVELRSVNQRGLKVTPRLSDSLSPLESRFEQWLRSRIQRGTLHANATFAPSATVSAGQINLPAVIAYANQLKQVQKQVGEGVTIELTGLLQLPGAVLAGNSELLDPELLWPILVDAANQAIDAMDAMKLAEGEAMAVQLRNEIQSVQRNLESIASLAPRVVDSYRQRLEVKIRRVLEEHSLEFSPNDLLRDIQLYADRSDISEEVTRLASHLKMFVETLHGNDSSGRKLDFIVQEMFRETNTIGSKSGDVEISMRVVEIKCAIERIRELVQNIQ